jgi:peptide deformylase
MNEEIKELDGEASENSVKDIIVAPDPRLHIVADRVKEVTAEIRDLVEKMFKTMNASDGIGLAATQLGINKRVIVMDVDHLDAYDDEDKSNVKHGKFVMINPVIISRSKRAKWVEGCLSVPGFKEVIERDLIVEVSYLDENGKQAELRASGLLSACIQHEIDHLDGKLFVDRLSHLKKDIILNKLKKFRKHGTMVVRRLDGPVL